MHPPEPTPTPAGRGREEFPPTQWTMILTAGEHGAAGTDEARANFCVAYWHPLYAFARRRGHSVEEAEDLTQEFFARLLTKNPFAGLKREGGRFRSFLLTTFKCFLANEWRREHAQKRGGGKLMLSIDDDAEVRYQKELIDQATPEAVFDRQWVATVLDRVMNQLRKEWKTEQRPELSHHLQTYLLSSESVIPYAELAPILNMTEPALRVAVHRARRRYGELLRAEIAATVSNPNDVDDEVRYLISVAGGGARST